MKTFSISGASDDLIETAGIPGCDEFNAIKDGPHIAVLGIWSSSGNIEVHCIYSGFWAFAIGPIDGDYDKMPSWEIRRAWGTVVPYSETVEIDVPDDAILTGDLVDKKNTERQESDR